MAGLWSNYILASDMIYQWLSTPSGIINANQNFASTSLEYSVQPSATQTYVLERMIVDLTATSTITAQSYGPAGATGLANGFAVKVITGSSSATAVDMANGQVITTLAHWGFLCYDVSLTNWGSGDEVFQARWTFTRSGSPLVLRGSESDKLSIVFTDNMSSLNTHRFMVQGYKV